MNRILAVREGDDVTALRRGISVTFHAKGDTSTGIHVNISLSELAESGVTEARRREIAEALARYAKANPEEMGQFLGGLAQGLLGAAVTRRPPRTPTTRGTAPDINAPRILTREEQRSIRSLERRAQEHEEKLEQYRRNPYSQDNEGRLRNAPNDEVRQQIMRNRIEVLEREIKRF